MKASIILLAILLSGCGDIVCMDKESLSQAVAEEIKDDMEKREIAIIGNTIQNLESLKQDCEKSLPRDQDCVLVYEYVPVKKEKSE